MALTCGVWTALVLSGASAATPCTARSARAAPKAEGAAPAEPSLETLFAEKLARDGMQGQVRPLPHELHERDGRFQAQSESRVGTQLAMEAYGMGACLLVLDENGEWTEESLARCQEAAWQEFQSFGALEYE